MGIITECSNSILNIYMKIRAQLVDEYIYTLKEAKFSYVYVNIRDKIIIWN